MLRELTIKNFALIDELHLEFAPGFNVLTGETGAGKSILVGAMQQFLGEKADLDWLRAGEEEAIIEGVFELSPDEAAVLRLRDMGLEAEGACLIRRHLHRRGQHKIFINGHRVTLAQLKAVGTLLIDLSGQHDQHFLLEGASHRLLLDACLHQDRKFVELGQAYGDFFSAAQNQAQKLGELQAKATDRDQVMEYLRYQVEELQNLALRDPLEEEALKQERARLRHGDQIGRFNQQSKELLYEGDHALISRLDHLMGEFASMEPILPGLKIHLPVLVEARDHLMGIYQSLNQTGLGHDDNPQSLEEIEARLFALAQVKRRHGPELSDVMAKYEHMKAELSALSNFDEILAEARAVFATQSAQCLKLAQALSLCRKQQAPRLEQLVCAELSDLALPRVQFKIRLKRPAQPTWTDCSEHGIDEVLFEFSANPGEAPKALDRVASGGELSRILLALKSVLTGDRDIPSLIFDEIDTGLGGGVAEILGLKLKQFSATKQVFCITHLPQIAARADRHFVLEKMMAEKTTKTRVRIAQSEGERVEEIARMLGGVQLTQKTRAHAKEMLNHEKKA